MCAGTCEYMKGWQCHSWRLCREEERLSVNLPCCVLFLVVVFSIALLSLLLSSRLNDGAADVVQMCN